MKHLLLSLLSAMLIGGSLHAADTDYVVIARDSLLMNPQWKAVAQTLVKRHKATLLTSRQKPADVLPQLQQLQPRYVAVVEQPERLDPSFVMELHRLSRQVDDDIYADFLLGIITGRDAAAAMRMVKHAQKPFVMRNCVTTIQELNSGKWFNRMGYLDDHVSGQWGEKEGPHQPVTTGRNFPEGERDSQAEMKRFGELYAKYDPDLVVTAAHATERNLEMPFSLGNVKPFAGRLYLDLESGPRFLPETGRRKVYLPIGNCLIGNVNRTRESMAIAWMNAQDAATFVGYVVVTWHGRNGWGGLKYLLTNPGRYTVAQAFYLNQQDMLTQLHRWHPQLVTELYPYEKGHMAGRDVLRSILGEQFTMDQLGFFYDRDVLAYYGDPKWDARLQQVKGETDFKVSIRQKDGRATVTVRTLPGFSLKRMQGDGWKPESVLDLPFSYFFPHRLKHPRLAPGQKWDATVDENFLLIHNADFQPGQTYQIELITD